MAGENRAGRFLAGRVSASCTADCADGGVGSQAGDFWAVLGDAGQRQATEVKPPARYIAGFGATVGAPQVSHSDIFVPESWILLNELAHHFNASLVLQQFHGHPAFTQKVFLAAERHVLANHHARDTV
jgi:hypothetical protein